MTHLHCPNLSISELQSFKVLSQSTFSALLVWPKPRTTCGGRWRVFPTSESQTGFKEEEINAAFLWNFIFITRREFSHRSSYLLFLWRHLCLEKQERNHLGQAAWPSPYTITWLVSLFLGQHSGAPCSRSLRSCRCCSPSYQRAGTAPEAATPTSLPVVKEPAPETPLHSVTVRRMAPVAWE